MQQAADHPGARSPLETVPLEVVRYDAATGLVPVVVQDIEDGTVLMVAYANREALKRTLGTGQAWFWSRSRQAYWRKGATSGNVLQVCDVRVDCDGDTVLYLVNAAGPACHTGARSCFFRQVPFPEAAKASALAHEPAVHGPGADAASRSVAVDDPGLAASERGAGVDPDAAGGGNREAVPADAGRADAAEAGPSLASLEGLWSVIAQRFEQRPKGAYTTYLFEQGIDKIAKKVGEEAVEVVIAAKNACTEAGANTAASASAGRRELQNESADLLYHLLVLWKAAGVSPAEVDQVLAARHTKP
ncbi:phosphoribosyl-AMP cyclohydrolase [Alicyclobacillus cycloheptanicus]|nr:phosphoribosyl-AMP cyclohydrolase [Alicyclobacillus cycloheptanicus]